MKLLFFNLFCLIFGGILQNKDNALADYVRENNEELTADFANRLLQLVNNKKRVVKRLAQDIFKEFEKDGLLITNNAALTLASQRFKYFKDNNKIDENNELVEM